MKNILKVVFSLLVSTLVFASCDDEKLVTGFTVGTSEITMGAEGGVEEVTVKSETEWVAIASEPWVMISPANGIGITECNIAIDSTLVNDMRTATIRFSTDGQDPQLITVRQTGFARMIEVHTPEVEIAASALKDERYTEVDVTTNVKFSVQVEYTDGATGWLTPNVSEVTLDRGSRPRTAKIKLDWKLNTQPSKRVAKVNFVPEEGVEIEKPAVLTLTQKAAPNIEDNRAGDSIAIVMIEEQLDLISTRWETSENMRNWHNLVLWEEDDKDLPCPEAVGRVRAVTYQMITTDESIPQEIRHLKYLESLSIQSNTNTMLKNIELGSEICELKHLKALSLFSYGLVSLPDDFVKLGESLEYLDLSANNFRTVPSMLNKENFPKLRNLLLIANRRWSTNDLRKAPDYKNDLGFHFNTESDNTLKNLLLWDTLEELRLSNNYMEGQIPDFKVGEDGVEAYTQADVMAWGGDTIQYLADKQIPKILPNMKLLSLNLNFFTGELPQWLLYHPRLLSWYPELLIFNQQEQGIDSKGKLVGFSNQPTTFEYYYEALPGTREKYELKEEITE